MKHLLSALALASLFFTAPAAAVAQEQQTDAPAKVNGPTMNVGPNTLRQGGTAEITYSDPSKAGETIEITIDNGMRRNTVVQTVTIVLDENGQGSATWTVPDWFGANFNAPGVPELNRAIL